MPNEYATLCKYNRGNAGRVYFYDIDTREELELDGQTGLSPLGRSECGIRGGTRYTDTVLSVDVLCHATRGSRTVTAADFPGRRVAVKTWYPAGFWQGQDADAQNIEWAYLADRRNGWQGNEADTGNTGRTRLGELARREAVSS